MCGVDGCKDNCIAGSGWCAKHTCSISNCKERSTAEWGKCAKHASIQKHDILVIGSNDAHFAHGHELMVHAEWSDETSSVKSDD